MTPTSTDLAAATATSGLWAGWIGAIAAVVALGVAIYFGVRQFRRPKVGWSIRPNGGERWHLVNDGPGTVHDVRIVGLSDIDRTRLTEVTPPPNPLPQAGVVSFVLVSRLSISGPASIVVTYRLRAKGPDISEVVAVPAE